MLNRHQVIDPGDKHTAGRPWCEPQGLMVFIFRIPLPNPPPLETLDLKKSLSKEPLYISEEMNLGAFKKRRFGGGRGGGVRQGVWVSIRR